MAGKESMSIIKQKKLSTAVAKFTSAMRTRLAQKEKEGYTGWDDNKQIHHKTLADAMMDDVKKLGRGNELNQKLCIDIANRAMMLWHRMGMKEYLPQSDTDAG